MYFPHTISGELYLDLLLFQIHIFFSFLVEQLKQANNLPVKTGM